jgi:hypothetical protein
MPIALPTGYLRTTIEPLDVRYNNETTGLPYANVAAAFAATQNIAYPGLFVNIDDGAGGSDLYWYKSLSSPSILITDLVAFSAGGSSLFNPPGPVTTAPNTGGYPTGTALSGPLSMQDMWAGLLYPYVPPTINASFILSSTDYNAQNVTVSGSLAGPAPGSWFFTWTKNPGSVDLISAVIEYSRVSATGPWTPLATTTNPVTYTAASPVYATVTNPFIINQAGVDNSPLWMRCVFTDSQSVVNTPVVNAQFAPYVSPIVNNLSATPKDGSGVSLLSAGTRKYVRSFVPYAQTDITGTLTGNTPLIDIYGYELYQSATGLGAWSVLPTSTQPVAPPNSGVAPTGTPFPMLPYSDTSTSLASIQDYYVQTYVDTNNNLGTYVPINIIQSYNMYPPVFAGLISAATYAGPVSGWLPAIFNTTPYTAQALIPNGASNNGGVCNYQRNANDRLLTGLNFITSGTNGDRFIVAYPASYPVMVSFGPTGTNLAPNFYPAGTPLPNTNPIPIIQNIIFGDGSNISYQIYIYGPGLSPGSSYFNYNLA